MHMLADALGRPLRFRLAPGQQHDLVQAPAMIEGFRAKAFLADTAYDSRAFRDNVRAIGAEPVIPSNPTASIPSDTTSANISSEPHRMLLQQTQALPTLRNPIRRARSAVKTEWARTSLNSYIVLTWPDKRERPAGKSGGSRAH